MQIEVNRDRCEAYGVCETAVPAVFHIDDESDELVLLPFVEGDVDRSALQIAVDSCPKNALTIVD